MIIATFRSVILLPDNSDFSKSVISSLAFGSNFTGIFLYRIRRESALLSHSFTLGPLPLKNSFTSYASFYFLFISGIGSTELLTAVLLISLQFAEFELLKSLLSFYMLPSRLWELLGNQPMYQYINLQKKIMHSYRKYTNSGII